MMKNTRQRERIIELLEMNTQPQSAEMIYDSLIDDQINLATIYRSLNLFLEHGLVTKSIINQTSYYTLAKHGHHHYLICLGCNKKEEIECDSHVFDDSISKSNFQIAYHDLTYFGYCNECQDKQNK